MRLCHKLDKNGESASSFGVFLTENGINHILAGVRHPQTNGKIEKWYHTYEKSRKLFGDFDKFLDWYNSIRYHESLDEKHYLQTPEDAFWSRMPQECNLNQFLLRMGKGFQCDQINLKGIAEYINAKHSGLYNHKEPLHFGSRIL
jgi:hypothetical protein